MKIFIIVILIYLIICYFELIPIIKRKQKKEASFYLIAILLSFSVSLLLSFGIKIPSPLKYIKALILIIIGQ